MSKIKKFNESTESVIDKLMYADAIEEISKKAIIAFTSSICESVGTEISTKHERVIEYIPRIKFERKLELLVSEFIQLQYDNFGGEYGDIIDPNDNFPNYAKEYGYEDEDEDEDE